uniref:Uncharacterized protein n=1 Tax=Arundo donax TaxID=35708 RepID=A0A0A9AF23_ARUDO
MYWGCVLIIMS